MVYSIKNLKNLQKQLKITKIAKVVIMNVLRSRYKNLLNRKNDERKIEIQLTKNLKDFEEIFKEECVIFVLNSKNTNSFYDKVSKFTTSCY